MRGCRTDDQAIALVVDTMQFRYRPQVDKRLRRGEPALHRRNQRVPPRKEGRVVVAPEQRQRVVKGLGTMIPEIVCVHAVTLRWTQRSFRDTSLPKTARP